MYRLSICYTVYNQSSILKKQLDTIIPIIKARKDMEIVISDDCSTENIKELIDSYNCAELHYYRTPNNLGHDLNILHAIEHALADHVMILRTRDCIYINNIDTIIRELSDSKECGYILFSAVDEVRNKRINLDNKTFQGIDAARAHFSLFVHPSGSIYNKRYLDIEKYRSYINKYFDNIYGFIVHELIRCDLSTKSSFMISNTVGWIYSDTLSSKDVAVNSAKSKVNVYAPEFGYPRYKCYLNFVIEEVPKNIRDMYIQDAIHRYYFVVIARAKTIANDKRYSTHYNSDSIKISRKQVSKKMNEITKEIFLKNDISGYVDAINKETLRCVYFYPLFEIFRNLFVNTPIYGLYRRHREGRRTAI